MGNLAKYQCPEFIGSGNEIYQIPIVIDEIAFVSVVLS